MIGVYERSLCQSYASAYRQGILLAKTGDEAEALSIVESLTDDSYQCFALLEDGTVLDLRGRFTSKREYREAVRRMGEEPGDTKGKDGLTSCIPGKGCVVWISRKVKAPDLYALAAHEATHAACDMLASIGEDTPAAEELAYMVQTITAGIIIACGGSDGDD